MALAREAGIEDRVKIVGKPLKEIKRGIRVRKESVALLAVLDKAVKSYVGTPAYQQVYAKWYGKKNSYWTVARVTWTMSGVLFVIVVVMAWWRYRVGIRLIQVTQKSEERLRGAVDSLEEGFILYDANDHVVAFNNEFRRISPEVQEIMGRGGTFEDVVRANVARGSIVEAIGREEEFIQDRIEEHRNPKGPIIRRFTNGKTYLIKEVLTPEGGNALSFIDITDLKQTEEALRENEMRFKDFAEAASDWFWEMDKNLRFTYHSPRYLEITGFSPEDKVGTSRTLYVDALDLEKDSDKWRTHIEDLEARRSFKDFEYSFKAKEGNTINARISGTPVFDAEGVFLGYRGTGTNITEHKKMENPHTRRWHRTHIK